jgi:hypothetical protein
MIAPYFLLRISSENGWGGSGSRLPRENSCVLPRIAYNSPAGVQQTGRQACRAVHRGFLTRAAKPKVRKSLTPQKFRCYCNVSSWFYFGYVLAILLPRLRSPQPVESDKQSLTYIANKSMVDVRLRTPLFDSEH